MNQSSVTSGFTFFICFAAASFLLRVPDFALREFLLVAIFVSPLQIRPAAGAGSAQAEVAPLAF
jgi:hypothetical protein